MKSYPTKINAAPNPETKATLLALFHTILIPYLAEVQKFSPDKAI
jgi:hypothetical protein